MFFQSFLCCSSHNINTVYSDDVPRESKGTIGEASNSNAAAKPTSPAKSSSVQTHTSVPSEPYTPQRSFSLFKSYADSDDPNVIGPEGYEKLCIDANLPLDGALPLILAWQLASKEMAKITKDEWTSGTESLKISSLSLLATAIHDLNDYLMLEKAAPKKSAKKDPYDRTALWSYCENRKAAFQKFYIFCFALAKPEQSRNIDMETACALWSVLLVPKFPIVGEILGFINEKGNYKACNKDLWTMMLEFCESISPNLSDYEGDGVSTLFFSAFLSEFAVAYTQAWPTLLDDFVSWKKGPTVNEPII
ncbi:hypothetical protein L208DRAFT_937295 [Tricholoma matsutake]|nr:hypothetical protein L208DRAFT_937295 [Tricholoma matsutake 945]